MATILLICLPVPFLPANERKDPNVATRHLDGSFKDGSLGVAEHRMENLEEHQQVQELEDVTDSGVGFGDKLLLFMIVFPTHEKERVEEAEKHE